MASVLILEPETGRRWMVDPTQAADGRLQASGLGAFDAATLTDAEHGDPITLNGKQVIVLPATPADYHSTLQRKAQIVQEKDAARIVLGLGLSAGMRVLESGVGSGGASLHIMNAIQPGGILVAQELRDDFADWAKKNIARAGLPTDPESLQIKIGDLTRGLHADIKGPFDAVLLDQPEPWAALPNVFPTLAPGARICAYCPQVSQMERTVHLLRQMDCADVQAMETIERLWEVKDMGSRPSFEGLGHSGFLVFARWTG